MVVLIPNVYPQNAHIHPWPAAGRRSKEPSHGAKRWAMATTGPANLQATGCRRYFLKYHIYIYTIRSPFFQVDLESVAHTSLLPSIVSAMKAQYVWWERRVLDHSEGVGKATGVPQLRRDPTKASKGHFLGDGYIHSWIYGCEQCQTTKCILMTSSLAKLFTFQLPPSLSWGNWGAKVWAWWQVQSLEASAARQLAEKEKATALGPNTESKFGQVGP